MSSLHTGTLLTSGGSALAFAARLRSESPTLLLLHGFADSWRSFLPLIGALPLDIGLLAISQRGHGDSDKPLGPYDTTSFADDAIQAMTHFGIERATVVGHSMGSLVAQRMAMEDPDRIANLVLISAFATLNGNPGVEALWRDAVQCLEDPVPKAFIRDFQQSCLARPVPVPFFAKVIEESGKVPARVWRAALRSLLDEDRPYRLCDIAAPTLIVWGDQDSFSNRVEQDLIARAIPRSRLSILRGVGHAPH